MGNDHGLPALIRNRDEQLQALERATYMEYWALEHAEAFRDSTGWFGKMMYAQFMACARRSHQQKMHASVSASVAQSMVACGLTAEIAAVRSWTTARLDGELRDDDEICRESSCKHERTTDTEEEHLRKE